MFFRIFFSLTFMIAAGLVAHPAFAGEEGGKEKAEAPKDEKKDEGKGEKSADDDMSESQKKQLNEANELQTKVQALQAKVKAKEESIHKLIEEKEETKDPAKVKEIISQMVSEHKEMTSLAEEYEQQRSLLRYRYPEKSMKGGRTYERLEVKPLEQMENQMSIETKLKRNMRTVHAQFGESEKDDKKKVQKKKDQKGNQAPSLTEPIVIEK